MGFVTQGDPDLGNIRGTPANRRGIPGGAVRDVLSDVTPSGHSRSGTGFPASRIAVRRSVRSSNTRPRTKNTTSEMIASR